MENIGQFAKAFGAPEGIEQALKSMTTPLERRLILDLSGRKPLTLSELASIMEISEHEARLSIDEFYHRGIVSLNGENRYIAGNLYSRLDLFAQFEHERWAKLPVTIRKNLDQWYLDEYGKRCIHGIVAKFENRARKNYGIKTIPASSLGNDMVLPHDEALRFLQTVPEKNLYVLPCNCRSIAMNCDFPVETCIQYSPPDRINSPIHRGWGRKISIIEAQEVMVSAHKTGLMHTVGEEAICNCDSCCCYPMRSSTKLMSKGIWPGTPYRVEWNEEVCIRCGACMRRCHMNVFNINTMKRKNFMVFDSSQCWGCGLCLEVCPRQALTLRRIA
ncbi:MAG: hypothetical protein CSA35_05585 [Dethiosulfovibrio peptidovorans]|nr:MAG: hypothetical protein CSA35_05585 [Dethiosulfovibrio peptidovorans]